MADKPASVLGGVERVAVTAIPIDFDRDNPEHKEFGKLVWRGGVNLFGKSSYFGGYSALAVDAFGNSLLAIFDAGTWLRASLDHDGRTLKGLSEVSIGPILGKDGKPLADDRERDSEVVALLDGDNTRGIAYVSFERDHRIERYPFTRDRFGPSDGALPSPPKRSRWMQTAVSRRWRRFAWAGSRERRRLFRGPIGQERQSSGLVDRRTHARTDHAAEHRRLRHYRRRPAPR
ncbi:MAG: esterase-like activity of phytase family protein [Methyloceanibacter sp.]